MAKKRKRSDKEDDEDPEKFCKKCKNKGRTFGENDGDIPYHQRITSADCPDRKKSHKSTLKDKLKEGKNAEGDIDDNPVRTCEVTVKDGLSGLLRGTPYRRHIQTALERNVLRMTLLTYEATRLADLYVTHVLEIGHNMHSLTYNDFMRLPFQAVLANSDGSPKATKNTILNHVRDTLYLPERRTAGLGEWNDGSRLSQCISLAAKVYTGNCQNHVTTNLFERMRKWWDNELSKTPLNFLNAGHRKGIFSSFREGSDSPPNFRSLSEAQNQAIIPVYLTLRHRCHQQIMENLSIDEEQVASHWWKYLKPLWNLLKYVERETATQTGLRLRRFTMLPLSTPQARYVHYDTDAFHDLLLSAAIPGVPSNKKDFRQVCAPNDRSVLPSPLQYDAPTDEDARVCDHWWKWTFKLETVTTINRHFGCYLSTDGMGTSVSIVRGRSTEEVYLPGGINRSTNTTDTGYKVDEEGQYHYVPLDILPDDKVVGVDPGRIDPFVCVHGPRREDKSGCSRKEYYQLAGFTTNARTRSKWMAGDAAVKRIISQMPSAKVSTCQALQFYLQYALRHMHTLVHFFNARRWKRLRWKAYIAKEKAWDTLVKRITDGDKRTVVALGNGTFAHNSRGHATTPTKQLRKRLRGKCRLRMIDEFRTSAECSLCPQKLPQKTRFWQVKVCPGCLTNWNRDVNAARNMRAIFLHMNLNGGQRPDRFSRQNDNG